MLKHFVENESDKNHSEKNYDEPILDDFRTERQSSFDNYTSSQISNCASINMNSRISYASNSKIISTNQPNSSASDNYAPIQSNSNSSILIRSLKCVANYSNSSANYETNSFETSSHKSEDESNSKFNLNITYNRKTLMIDLL